ncbi:unnamed protein product, partial [Sphacelaria rigidula]
MPQEPADEVVEDGGANVGSVVEVSGTKTVSPDDDQSLINEDRDAPRKLHECSSKERHESLSKEDEDFSHSRDGLAHEAHGMRAREKQLERKPTAAEVVEDSRAGAEKVDGEWGDANVLHDGGRGIGKQGRDDGSTEEAVMLSRDTMTVTVQKATGDVNGDDDSDNRGGGGRSVDEVSSTRRAWTVHETVEGEEERVLLSGVTTVGRGVPAAERSNLVDDHQGVEEKKKVGLVLLTEPSQVEESGPRLSNHREDPVSTETETGTEVLPAGTEQHMVCPESKDPVSLEREGPEGGTGSGSEELVLPDLDGPIVTQNEDPVLTTKEPRFTENTETCSADTACSGLRESERADGPTDGELTGRISTESSGTIGADGTVSPLVEPSGSECLGPEADASSDDWGEFEQPPTIPSKPTTPEISQETAAEVLPVGGSFSGGGDDNIAIVTEKGEDDDDWGTFVEKPAAEEGSEVGKTDSGDLEDSAMHVATTHMEKGGKAVADTESRAADATVNPVSRSIVEDTDSANMATEAKG